MLINAIDYFANFPGSLADSMFHNYFGLQHLPFHNTPDVNRFFGGGLRADVLRGLLYCLQSGAAITKVVGEVGSGKTMLCRMLQHHMPKQVQTAYLLNPNLPPRHVYHAIAAELGIPAHRYNRVQIHHELYRHLLERHRLQQQVVLIVDEAQTMPVASLEEIRLLTNLETGTDKLLQIYLFGQPELDTLLAQSHIRQLRERIQYSFYLTPLQEKEIIAYLGFRLRAAGFTGQLFFSKAACHRIARYSLGLIRRVNILAEKSLLAAFCEGSDRVQKRHVQQAYFESEFGMRKAHWIWSLLGGKPHGVT